MLILEKINKSYGTKRVLEDVDLEIPAGICFGIVGPNGAGKSTLLKIIASVIRDYEGNVQVKKDDLSRILHTIGYVPQEISLEETLSASSNLYFFGGLYGLTGKQLKTRVEEVLKVIGLTEHAKENVMTFSSGMKRRLNIGCAFMHQPKLIIMDEPTVGVDPQSRKYIFQMLRRMKQAGTTIIYATHYMEEVEQLCEEIAFMDKGQIIEKGNMNRLLQKYATQAIFVKSRKNIDATLREFGRLKERQGGRILETQQPLLAMEQVIQLHRNEAEMLQRLELVEPRLEDVFFQLTGTALREEKELSNKKGVAEK